MAFADNLKKLPSVEHLEKLDLIDATGKVVARIEPGRRIEGESGRVSDGETRRKRRTG